MIHIKTFLNCNIDHQIIKETLWAHIIRSMDLSLKKLQLVEISTQEMNMKRISNIGSNII